MSITTIKFHKKKYVSKDGYKFIAGPKDFFYLKDGIKFFITNPVFIHYTKLKLWKENPRFNDGGVSSLAQMLKANGVRSSVVAWSEDMTIYKGNTTFKALRSLGCTQIPVDLQSFSSEQAAIAYGISDNKASEFSSWDKDVLGQLMQAE